MSTQTNLFSPLSIKDITFRNRIAVSPMCQYSSIDGLANDWHLVHLGSRAAGGAGLVMVEASAVEPRGRISPDDMGIWDEEHIEPLKRITEFVKQYGAVPGIQIAHAGRKGSTASPWKMGSRSQKVDLTDDQGGFEIVAPSAIPFSKTSRIPKELTKAEIKEIIQKFADAAKRALEAGFQVLEIHAAHGYLLNSFYSPLSNKRNDEYGGTFENRIRLLLEVVSAVKNEWTENLPLFVRLSCSDWADGGFTIDDSIQLAKHLKENGVDLIDCSSGYNVDYARYPYAPGWQVSFAERIKTGSKILTAAVGLITQPDQANQIIEQEQADLVMLAREMMRDPYWPFHAAKTLGFDQVQTLPKKYTYAI